MTAVSLGQNSRVDSVSVTTRLISSGITRLNDRKPASTCAIGTCILAAASAPASVEFVSPYTSTASGVVSAIARSMPTSMPLVCSPWDAEPTPSSMSGFGIASSPKEALGHGLVVMLSGVQQNLAVTLAQDSG